MLLSIPPTQSILNLTNQPIQPTNQPLGGPGIKHPLPLRFVDTIRPIFQVLQLWKLDLHNETYVTLKTGDEDQQKLGWKLDLTWFSYHYWRCVIVESLTEYIGRPNYFY